MCQRQTLANILRKCSKKVSLDHGLQTHALVLRTGFDSDMMLSNDLIDMYGKCGRPESADKVFDKMPQRNVVSWTSLMCCHLQNANPHKCLSLLRTQMRDSGDKPNEFTLSTSLKACGTLTDSKLGTQIHSLCAKSGLEWVVVVGNSILGMYAKCGRVSEATRAFEVMPFRSLITWNAMIAGFEAANKGKDALTLFREMQSRGERPDEFTLTSTLKVCTGLGAIKQGTQMHGSIITRGFWSQNPPAPIAGALLDLYTKCGLLLSARRLFENIDSKNIISVSSLILGYAQEGNLEEAVELFKRLRRDQIDQFVLSSLAGIFADLALLEQGMQVHALAVKTPSGFEISVANSILDMYLKCGALEDSERFFDEIPKKNVISWTSMITGYGKYGLGRKSVELFCEMESDENSEPDSVTYLATLTACSHAGLINEGQEIFLKLCNDDRISLRIEHYSCMADLLGRAGRLKEAHDLIKTMPLSPTVAIWQTLLSACRVHGDLEMGTEVGERLVKLDGGNSVNYVTLSNLYADFGYWRESERLRKEAKGKGLKKEAGRSWVEIEKEVHYFYNGDDSHPRIGEIREALKEVETRMRAEIGYVPGVRFALHDVEEESKEEILRFHSEKLAIGLALVSVGFKEKRIIRIFKNLRVCGDCHSFIKGLSEVLNMVFLVRDANRFHRFENGLCSCGDYW